MLKSPNPEFDIQNPECKRIVIIGPESTGKSTLCEELSQHYNAPWCPEFAREYLLTYGKEYDYEDLLSIAKGQIALEDEYAILAEKEWKEQDPKPSAKPVLFIDTNMYVMKVWCEFVFGQCHQYIIDQIVARPYDLYLLCNTDLPWTRDELREYPDHETRQTLYLMYKDILVNQEVPWVDISGNDEQRLHAAIEGIQRFLPNLAK
ncbi:MAG TPA: ATP-binding protein [Chitinophagaceae bacterium]|nr:ATP-binding protein [Chitinophagaceae bacterium]